MGTRPPAYRGLPQVYADGRSRLAVAQRRRYVAITADLVLGTLLLRLEGWRVSRLGVEADEAACALAAARQVRVTGKGRRPNPRAIERLARRAGLADATYSAALAKLREMAAESRRPLDLARELAAIAHRNQP